MLTVTTSQGTVSQDCKTIPINDTTGTGATGYLAPNYVVANVAELVFDCIIPNASVYTPVYVLTGSNAQNIMNGTTTLNVTSMVLDQALTTNSALPDGVYFGRYVPYFTAASTLSVTNNSVDVVASSAWNVAPYEGVGRVKINGTYYGLTVTGANTGKLDSVYTGANNAAIAWLAGFESLIPLKQVCNSERCLALKRANLYTTNCQCSEIEKNEVTNRQLDLNNAIEMFDNGDYVQFQSVMNTLTTYCNDSENGCNCH